MRPLSCSWLLLALSPFAVAQKAVPKRALLHPDVQQLLARETRDAAMTRILERGVYRGPGTYTEKETKERIGHIVLCPQPSGPPMFAVFLLGVTNRSQNVPRGHVITVAADGAIVRYWRGANSLDGDAVFDDVNGDGVVDNVGTINCAVQGGGTVRELFVVPITEDVTAQLRVAIDFREAGPPESQTAWRVVRAHGDQPARIQIGPLDPSTGELAKVIAEWRWHADHKAWVGPGGGPGQPFVRLPPEGWAGLEEFAAAQRGKREGR